MVHAVHVGVHITEQYNRGCQLSRDPKLNGEKPYRIVRGNSCNTISDTQSRDWDEAANSILPEPHPDLRLI